MALCVRCASRGGHASYTQGMNFIAGMLLLVTRDGEETFWMLTVIVEDLFPSLFASHLIGAQVENRTCERLLQQAQPELYQHLQAMSIPPTLLTTQWFMTLFVWSLPAEATCRLWDAMLLPKSGGRDGWARDALLRLALAMFAENSEELLIQDGVAAVMEHVQALQDGMTPMEAHELVQAALGPDALATLTKEAIGTERMRCDREIDNEMKRVSKFRELHGAFKKADADGSGQLGREEFCSLLIGELAAAESAAGAADGEEEEEEEGSGGMKGAQMPFILSEINALFDQADTDQSGAIDRQEFNSACLHFPAFAASLHLSTLSGSLPVALRQIFDHFDKSEPHASLDEEELCNLVTHIYSASNATLDERGDSGMEVRRSQWKIEAAYIFKKADKDGNGRVDFDEFFDAAQHTPVLSLGISHMMLAGASSTEQTALTSDPTASMLSTRSWTQSALRPSAAFNADSNFTARLVGTEQRGPRFRKYTVYLIEVASDVSEEATIARRYSDFEKFHAVVERGLPALVRNEFPAKALNKGKGNVIEQRKEAFTKYLDGCFATAFGEGGGVILKTQLHDFLFDEEKFSKEAAAQGAI